MRITTLACLALWLGSNGIASASETGEVVWVDPSCDHFIAKVGEEFGTYNWRAGKAPSKGDRFEGDLMSLEAGPREIRNLTSGGSNTVYILAMGPRLYSMIHTAPVQCKERFRGAAG
jgi:hypothetical protein